MRNDNTAREPGVRKPAEKEVPMKNSNVMTRRHPRWAFFYQKLWHEGCQFRWARIKGKVLWDCNEDFTHARGILRFMGLDVEASVSYFRRNGARCDCEVVFVLREGGKYDPRAKKKHGRM